MKNNKYKSLKLHIRYELAYEIIFASLFIILVGLAYLFASNLLTFNWFTVIFGGLAVLLLYLKVESYLYIENDLLTITYIKFLTKETIQMVTINEFVFYESNRIVEIKSNHKVIARIYLTEKNKQKLLDYIIKKYTDIPCLFLKGTS